MQFHAIPCNTMQYNAIPCHICKPCNTMQCHASLITVDGAYHCPVGSIRPFFLILRGNIGTIREGPLLWKWGVSAHRFFTGIRVCRRRKHGKIFVENRNEFKNIFLGEEKRKGEVPPSVASEGQYHTSQGARDRFGQNKANFLVVLLRNCKFP